ncbi:hypothetical protein GS40_24690, partial [Escherichia coli]
SKAPEGVLPISQTQQGEAQIWRREVSSRYGQYPKAQAAQPDQLMSDYFFRVSLAMQNKTLLFSLDDTGGIITRSAWGIMTWRSVTGLGNPSDRAASC